MHAAVMWLQHIPWDTLVGKLSYELGRTEETLHCNQTETLLNLDRVIFWTCRRTQKSNWHTILTGPVGVSGDLNVNEFKLLSVNVHEYLHGQTYINIFLIDDVLLQPSGSHLLLIRMICLWLCLLTAIPPITQRHAAALFLPLLLS